MQLTAEAAARAFRAADRRAPLQHIGVAVSGGGDSMALLHLARGWAQAEGRALSAVTVDHALRPESAREAAFVCEACAALGIPHETLRWQGWDGKGNLQDAARRARYALLAEWAVRRGVSAVALGHTQDDQAETFLMRLARGSGVDGLSAMRHDWRQEGARFLRPLCEVSREDLRAFLRARGGAWVEDPSNEDSRFDRVKARRALAALEPLGLTRARLADTARSLSRARAALRHYAAEVAENACKVEAGDVVLGLSALEDAPAETRLRLLAQALRWVSCSPYRPRFEALGEALAEATAGRGRSLHGCLIRREGASLRVSREYNAVKGLCAVPGAPWDSRWRLTGPGSGVEIRALGDAITDTPWRETGLPRASLLASPAVFDGPALVAAPVAGFSGGWTAEIAHPWGDFDASLLTH